MGVGNGWLRPTISIDDPFSNPRGKFPPTKEDGSIVATAGYPIYPKETPVSISVKSVDPFDTTLSKAIILVLITLTVYLPAKVLGNCNFISSPSSKVWPFTLTLSGDPSRPKTPLDVVTSSPMKEVGSEGSIPRSLDPDVVTGSAQYTV